MEIKPLRTDADYDAALREIERLWGSPPGSPEGDTLDVLATLVEVYEREHYPAVTPDPIAAIRFRMEQQGLSPRDLEGVIGSRSRVYEVLTGRRPLTLAMIRRLSAELGIPAEVLIREPAQVQPFRVTRRGSRKAAQG